MAADLPPLRSDKPPPPRDRATASYSSVPTTSDPSPSSAVGSPQPLPPAMADPLLTMATPSPPLALRRRNRPPSRDPSLLELLLTPQPRIFPFAGHGRPPSSSSASDLPLLSFPRCRMGHCRSSASSSLTSHPDLPLSHPSTSLSHLGLPPLHPFLL